SRWSTTSRRSVAVTSSPCPAYGTRPITSGEPCWADPARVRPRQSRTEVPHRGGQVSVRSRTSRVWHSRGAVAAVSAAAVVGLTLAGCAATTQSGTALQSARWSLGNPTTPIKHVVVLFDENI